MSTDIDWQHELDSSFGSGHDVATGQYVVAGRRAVRRRRVAAVVVAATVAICGGAAWAASPGSAPRGDAPVATQGPAPTEATEDPDRRRVRGEEPRQSAPPMTVQEEFLGNPAILEPDGTLKMSPLAGEVLQRVPNPMGYTPEQGRSTAIRVMYQGREQYSLIASFGTGGWSINTNDATGDFAGWVATNVRNQQNLDVVNGVTASSGDASGQPWLTLDDQGGLASARPGVVIAEVRADVDLGDSFSVGSAAAGVVRLLVDGRSELAAYRVVDGTLDVVRAPGSFESMDAFITWAREQYASGAGLR
jgi:hypothetical protein